MRRRRQACVRRRAVSSSAGQPLYWGATIGSQLTGTDAPWDMNAVSDFEHVAGKQLSLVQFFQPFADCSETCKPYAFPFTPLENVRQHGAIPVVSWSSQSIPSSLDQPEFQLSDIIEGHQDELIRKFAEGAREWGHPFFLRFDWEMNGDWFPWSESTNGNSAGQYVAAWRHVHDIFTSVGATNVTWAWCPYVDPGGKMQSLASLYPGDEYVDWTCLDGYNWGTGKRQSGAQAGGWRSFNDIFANTYKEITEKIAPSKPMMIGEIGSSEAGGSKAEWIKDALARIPTEYSRVKAVLWFDTVADGMNWPIETSQAASSAFAEGVGSPAYLGNSFATLGAGSVPAPS